MQTQDKVTDRQLSDEQSREIAETIREELARRRISRQALAEQAKLSLSTLEKVLGGRRPFTLATTVRLEQALGVSLRKSAAVVTPPAANDVAPDSLGSYAHRAVTWLEDVYITLRPSFGDKDAIFAYRTEIVWEPKVSSLVFREGERTDAAYEHTGEVAVPHQSGFIYLVIIKHGQHRVITVSRPTVERRDVWHHLVAPRRTRLAIDADRSADRLCATQQRRKAVPGTGRPRIPQPCVVWKASAPHGGGAVRLFLPG